MTHQQMPDQEEAMLFGSAPETSRVRWDDSRMRSAYANTLSVSATREEVSLSFGLQDACPPDATEVPVQLSERIIMSPQMARRLLTQLNSLLRTYDSGCDSSNPPSRLPALADQLSSPARLPSSSDPASVDEKASRLFQLVQSLNVEVGFERSFKISERCLLGNRFLLGARTGAIKGKREESILDICARLGMPEASLRSFKEKLPEASYVHFGFEENEHTCVYKAYLEFWERIEKEIQDTHEASKPFLLHLGFKWDASDNTKCSVTEYTWYPWLPLDDIVGRLLRMLDPQRHRHSLETAKAILGLASARIPHHDILYLEVSEEDNPRRSFDINVYRAGLQIGELYPILLKTWRHYSIPAEKWHELYGRVASKTFGHLSGGIDRGGKDFLSVYYGVEGIQDTGLPSRLSAHEAPIGVRPGQMPSRKSVPSPGVERTDEKAGLLFRLVNSLPVRVGFERSFKLLEKTLLADRFLLGFKRDAIAHEPNESIMNICRQIGMPTDFLEAFHRDLPKATIVLFGFEGNGRERLYKAYLEFGSKFGEVLTRNSYQPEPFLIHLGFKWDASDDSQNTVARYTCFPSFTVEDMLRRISQMPCGRTHRGSFEIARGIVHLAASRVDPAEFLYFESTEENNPRSSFDINLYRAKLRMRELYPLLLEMSRYYSIPDEQFHGLYQPAKSQTFGHLTGGIDREGRDFFTVYFGEKGSSAG